MPYRTLADFLEDLGRAGELAAVDAEVDPCLEVAEVTRRIARQNGPALLFRNVRGHDIPLLTNLFGTESRILRALGADSIEEATARIDRALNSGGSEGWLERLRFGGKSGAAASYAPTKVKSAACQQIVRLGSDINLLELPLMRSNEKETVRTIHSPVMISAEPETHAQVCLRGDLHITGRDSAVATWSDIADPFRLRGRYRELGSRMPLAIVIGGDPSVQLAAAAPLASAVERLALAGLLREKPFDAVACRTVDLAVPAESDFIIEGWIDPTEHNSPVFADLRTPVKNRLNLTAVTHRANRVFPEMAPGIDYFPQEVPDIGNRECCVRDRVLARLFLPHLKTRIPELVDFDLPLSGGARDLAILAIEKTHPTHTRRIAMVAWGIELFQFARVLIFVDADVDVRDTELIIATVVRNAKDDKDVLALDGPCDSFGDPTRRLAIDATRKLGLLRHVQTEKLVTERWAEYGLGLEASP